MASRKAKFPRFISTHEKRGERKAASSLLLMRFHLLLLLLQLHRNAVPLFALKLVGQFDRKVRLRQDYRE